MSVKWSGGAEVSVVQTWAGGCELSDHAGRGWAVGSATEGRSRGESETCLDGGADDASSTGDENHFGES